MVNSAGSCLHIGKLLPDFVMNFSYGTGMVRGDCNCSTISVNISSKNSGLGIFRKLMKLFVRE